MANKDNEYEFEDDNDDEFNQDGTGWTDSDNPDDPDDWPEDPNDEWPPADELEEDAASEIENEFWRGYYEKDDKNAALQSFLKVIQLIENGGDDTDDFKFKSLTEIVILYFNNNAPQETIKYHKQFLSASKTVKPNDLSSNLRKILAATKANESVYNEIHQITMEHFKPQKDETSDSIKHLWFALGIERCHDFMDHKQFKKCQSLINELHENLKVNGKDNMSETAKLLQVYAVKIQLTMYLIDDLAIDGISDENEYNGLQLKLRELIGITHEITTNVAITDNKSMSIIYECWAKVYASSNDWNNAYKYFKESFLLYQQIAHKNTTKCLKYLLISYMILSSLPSEDGTITNIPNPFAMDEIKVYQYHQDIVTINNLVNAFENDDIATFNKLLKQQYDIDPFIVKILGLAQLRLQGKALINLVGSYDRVKLEWLCFKLGMTLDGIEKLIVKLIIDNELIGRLDQVNMILILKERDDKQNKILNSFQVWLKTVNNLRGSINSRAAQKLSQSFGGGGRGGFGGYGGLGGMGYFDDDMDDLYVMDQAFLSWDY